MIRPKYPHLLFSFAFLFSQKFETYCDIFETYWCVSRLNPSLFETYSVRPPSMVTVPMTAPVDSGDSRIWKIGRRRVHWRHRFHQIRNGSSQIWRWRFENYSGLASFLSPYSSKLKMDTSVTIGGARRTFCRWFCPSTRRSTVTPPLKLYQWRFGEKEEGRRWRTDKIKEKKLRGIFVQIPFLVLLKHELLKWL